MRKLSDCVEWGGVRRGGAHAWCPGVFVATTGVATQYYLILSCFILLLFYIYRSDIFPLRTSFSSAFVQSTCRLIMTQSVESQLSALSLATQGK